MILITMIRTDRSFIELLKEVVGILIPNVAAQTVILFSEVKLNRQDLHLAARVCIKSNFQISP